MTAHDWLRNSVDGRGCGGSRNTCPSGGDEVTSKTEGHIQHVAGQQSHVLALAYLKVHQGKLCILITARSLTNQIRVLLLGCARSAPGKSERL